VLDFSDKSGTHERLLRTRPDNKKWATGPPRATARTADL